MRRSARLLRLARAQSTQTDACEARLAAAEQALRTAQQRRQDLVAVLDSVTMPAAFDRSSVLQRICRLDVQLSRLRAEADEHRRQLRLAKGRQDALVERAAHHASVEERRRVESEMQEVALAMHGKASGKGSVVK